MTVGAVRIKYIVDQVCVWSRQKVAGRFESVQAAAIKLADESLADAKKFITIVSIVKLMLVTLPQSPRSMWKAW